MISRTDKILTRLKEFNISIHGCEPTNPANDIWLFGEDKMIIFENEKTFTDLEVRLKFLSDTKAHLKNRKILHIPFFVGINDFTISAFLTGDANYHIHPDNGLSENPLQVETDFSVLPSNFNAQGLISFIHILNELSTKQPVFKDGMVFDDIKDYLVNKVVETFSGRVEMVLPKQLLAIEETILDLHSYSAMKTIFTECSLAFQKEGTPAI